MGRKAVLFKKGEEKLFKLSRTKIENFVQCPRCFYLDQKMGIKRPSSYPPTLNIAVDALMKKEFDHYRELEQPHPCQVDLNLIPAKHEQLEEWRNQFSGVKVEFNGFLVYGGIDDLWFNTATQEYHVADYKATSNKLAPTLHGDWKASYRRQCEMYGWMLSKNDLNVSKRGYFVYVNANAGLDGFNGRLEFDTHLLPYDGNWSWIESTINNIRDVLESDTIPAGNEECEYCKFMVKLGVKL
jgi:hypothetical protein